ncbi:hypothetical protein [Stenotrophomonas sp. PS02300]|uniref:hypothetical protein n=1 Tax=Stenotrophomonas sp. PS02300 TaxID=2991426 RepID=UPI00249A8793|nr:hypothetical protein [Stenotrophomonas sp. PS02300]
MNRLFPLTLALLLAVPAVHAEDIAPAPETASPLSESETAAALARAEQLGRAIFLHDLAAERATDALVAQHRAFRKDKRVRGWITEEHDGRYRVSYIDATPAVLYRVEVLPDGSIDGPVEVLPVPAALSPYEAGAAAARNLAMTAQVASCARTYNSVVLPGGDDRWSVYLLPGTTSPTAVPLGGSHRLDIVGGEITASRGFTRSCIQLNRAPSTRGAKMAAMMVTHMLDATPTEAHVYWSLWARTPMVVVTGEDAIWEIENGRIRRMADDADTGTAR